MIHVVLADDQTLVRAGFRSILDGEPDITVLAEAANGLEAVRMTRELRPDVVLMDIRMPELDGLEATRRIAAENGASKVLILTTFDLDEYVYDALRSGASGFLVKDTEPTELIHAVRVVARGDALRDRAGDHPPADRRVRRPGATADSGPPAGRLDHP